MKAFVALISGALLASPALAQSMDGPAGSGAGLVSENQSVPESTGGAGAANANDERRICRRIEVSSYSRIATRRVCRTAGEWRQAQQGT